MYAYTLHSLYFFIFTSGCNKTIFNSKEFFKLQQIFHHVTYHPKIFFRLFTDYVYMLHSLQFFQFYLTLFSMNFSAFKTSIAFSIFSFFIFTSVFSNNVLVFQDAICQTQQCRRAEGHYQSNLSKNPFFVLVLSNILIF